MKKFVALALFAVMVLALIPVANAAAPGTTAFFVSKAEFDQYADDASKLTFINTTKDGATFKASVPAADLKISYASKYDAEGKAYYYLMIPIPAEIDVTTNNIENVKLNGEKVLFGNLTFNGKFYKVGYADVANGFNKTFTWTATSETANTTVKYTVKLDVTQPAAPLSAMKYNISGKGDGYSISTKNGVVFVDFAPFYLAATNKLNNQLDAVLTLTVDGKNPIPDKEFGYLDIEYYFFNVPNGNYVSDYAYKNTDTIKIKAPSLAWMLGFYYGNDDAAELDFLYSDDVRMNIDLDTSKGTYHADGIKVVYRIVDVGDPKGILFTDGATKNVTLGDTFTLPVEGKEATLMTGVQYMLLDPMAGNVLIDKGDGSFFAVKAGTQYVRANFTWMGQLYSATIKVVVTEEPATTAYYVVCRALNVRKGPSTSYGKLGLVYRNDVIDVISVSNGWAKIWYKGAEAYVSFKYIDKK